MRILQVAHGFPPHEWAGTELVTYTLSQALQARGHQVTVFARMGSDNAAEFSLHAEHLAKLDVVRVVNNFTQLPTFRSQYDNPFLTEPFLQVLERCRPEVVHFQHLAHLSVSLLPLTAQLGYPTVLSVHDFFFACHRVHLIDVQTRLCPGPERGERCVACLQAETTPDEARRRFSTMECILQVPERVLAPSAFLAQRIQDYFPFVAKRLRVISPGLSPQPTVSRRRSPGAPLRILYIGILMPHKGAHLLIEALAGLPPGSTDVSLYGATLSSYQPYVDRLHHRAQGLSVRFCGTYSYDQLGAVLSQHDVLVLPSICEETFSLVTREALMAGLPVIAARRGALPEAVQDGVNGLLFEPEDVEDLRRCLLRVVTEPDLLIRLRSAAPRIKRVEEYAEDMEKVYQEICAAPERLPRLQRQLATQYHAYTQLQQEHERLSADLETLSARQHAVMQERDHAVALAEEQAKQLKVWEGELQEQRARLDAIYASVTWKLYRMYAVLTDLCVRRPLRVLKQWWWGARG